MGKKMKLSVLIMFVLLCGASYTFAAKNTQVQEGDELLSDLHIIGQAEYITVLPQKYRYRARIDSGATTCSMSALDIEIFERDGKKWVRFRLPLPADNPKEKLKKSDPQEYPITREVNIKRHGAEDQIRPAVKLKVHLGDLEGRIEFTLTDRSKYEFPVLIGRNLLNGNFLIDVSRSYVAKEKE